MPKNVFDVCEVGLTLNDPELIKQKVYAVYPVLLASENFRDWWVAADKRHAHPTPFWRSRTAAEMGLYTYVSEDAWPQQIKAIPFKFRHGIDTSFLISLAVRTNVAEKANSQLASNRV